MLAKQFNKKPSELFGRFFIDYHLFFSRSYVDYDLDSCVSCFSLEAK